MAESKHAILSASGSHKWIPCPPSARLEQGVPDESLVDYKDAGTMGHTGVAMYIYAWLEHGGEPSDFDLATWKASKYWDVDMQDAVDTCVEWTKVEYAKAQAVDPSAKLLVEAPADFSEWVPEGWGTADITIVYSDTLLVPDWKFGEGILVAAVNNSQARLYALGRLRAYQDFWDLKKVVTVIVQPRRDWESREEITVEHLLQWAEDVVRPAAKLAWEGKGAFLPGEWCRFCKVKDTCSARIKAGLAIVDEVSTTDLAADPPLVTHEYLSELIKSGRLEFAESIITSLMKYAYKRTAAGDFPGFKMVEGRKVRAYADPLKVEAAVVKAGVEKAMIWQPPALIGIGDMTKLLGKKKFAAVLETCDPPLIVKVAGNPKMVPDESTKQPLNHAQISAERLGEYTEGETNG